MKHIDLDSETHLITGIGYKSNYYKDLHTDFVKIGWLEIHAENYMMAGGPRKKMLQSLAEKFPISCHGVGLSIGAETGLSHEHLTRLKVLTDWLQPTLFSEHLAWSSHNAGYFNDLLPLPYTKETLIRVSNHINQVQDTLGRQMLLENPSTYVTFEENEMSEIEFIKEIVSRTNCGLLLDVNNVFVSATNQKYDPYEYIDAYPIEHVGEIHLGGHDEDMDEQGHIVLIDSHNRAVTNPVWKLYAHTIARRGLCPTLIEWDADLPEFSVLLQEAEFAQSYIQKLQAKRNPTRPENSHEAMAYATS